MSELHLLRHVMDLENKTGVARGREVKSKLQELGITPFVQECHFPKITNFIVDFSQQPGEKHLLFSAHYDAVKNSPGANDNASSVAVLLGLCSELRNMQIPVRVIFFDREEAWLRTPFFRLGLLGSLYYVLKNDLSDVEAVYNLEYCGLGDSLAVWPVKEKKRHIPAVVTAQNAAGRLNMNVKPAHVPGLLLSSDHLSFRIKGLSNSVTLSLLPADQLLMLENFVSGLSIPGLLFGRRPPMPGVLSGIHKPIDHSSLLSEDSLMLMLSLLIEIIHSYEFQS